MVTFLETFVHRFEPGSDGARPVLLALHGTGGDENDLIPLARMIDSRAPILSPRGRVLENGMPRFFRRLAEGVFDQEDLRVRTRELGEFIEAAAAEYGFDRRRVVAVGYSNGANIAASLMLAKTGSTETGTPTFSADENSKEVSVPVSVPAVFAGAVLLRPMVPFEPAATPSARGTQILISASRQDPIVPPSSTERLAELLAAGGAEVTMRWYPTGHGLSQREIEDAAAWYVERFQ